MTFENSLRKITDPRLYNYKKLYDEGLTYAEIGKKMGVSKQAAYETIKRYFGVQMKHKKLGTNQGRYKNLDRRLVDMGYIHYSTIAKELGFSNDFFSRVNRVGIGCIEFWKVIKLAKFTGMPLEWLFKEDFEEDNDD